MRQSFLFATIFARLFMTRVGANLATTTIVAPEISGNASTEYDLHLALFERYNPNIRPVIDPRDIVSVTMTIYLYTVEELDEKRQTLGIRSFSEIIWKDQYLTWEPEHYNNISMINVPTHDVWLPDIVLKYSAGRATDIGHEGSRAVISSDGSVAMWPTKILTVGCKIRIKYYPFDKQECIYEFLPWTNPSSTIELSWAYDQVSYSFYWESGEWRIEHINLTRYQAPYGEDTWDHIEFQMTLRRKWLYHLMNILGPVLLISILNVNCFVLPAECGEKATLCISVFLTLAVFLTIVNGSLPESSDDVSILGVYIMLQFVGSGLAIVATVISLFLYYKDDNSPVPGAFRCFAMALRVPKPKSETEKTEHQDDGDYRVNNNVDFTANSPTETSAGCTGGGHVTWKTVSCAFDRLCFWMSILWHVVLLAAVAISVLSPDEANA